MESFGSTGLDAFLGKGIMLVLSFFVVRSHNIRIKDLFPIQIILLLLIWAILQIIKYQAFSPYVLMRFMNLYFAVLLMKTYGEKLPYAIVDIVTKLSIISLVGWFFLLVARPVLEYISEMSFIPPHGTIKGNLFLIYGLSSDERNCGFAWEPGRYACILVTAIFFDLLIRGFRLKRDKNVIILLLALASTMSTTGVIVLLFVMLLYIYNKKPKYIIGMLPFYIVGFVFVMNQDFMYDKILNLMLTEDHNIEWENAMSYYATLGDDYILVPQRFDGLLYEFLNIVNDPLIGNATDTYSYLYSLFGIKFSLSNGVLRVFANMGIFIGLLYYRELYKASKLMSEEYNYKGALGFFIFFVLINFSYSWCFEPLYLAFVFKPYINKIKV